MEWNEMGWGGELKEIVLLLFEGKIRKKLFYESK